MMVQTIKNTKGTSKSKNSLHSEYAHKLNEYKSRITKIQAAITFEKIFISYYKRNGNNADLMGILYNRLGVLRNENNSLSEEIRKIRSQIKGHQRSKAVSSKYQQRMYSMVLRQLNPMQKGIQSLHSVVEYGEMMKTDVEDSVKTAYNVWADRDKTMIVLDGGTSVDLVEAIFKLKELGVPHTTFHEPDLYGCLTSMCFVADERVWDTKNYPSYEQYVESWLTPSFKDGESHVMCDIYIPTPTKEEWIDNVFKGEDPTKIMELRNLIFSKKLSM